MQFIVNFKNKYGNNDYRLTITNSNYELPRSLYDEQFLTLMDELVFNVQSLMKEIKYLTSIHFEKGQKHMFLSSDNIENTGLLGGKIEEFLNEDVRFSNYSYFFEVFKDYEITTKFERSVE